MMRGHWELAVHRSPADWIRGLVLIGVFLSGTLPDICVASPAKGGAVRSSTSPRTNPNPAKPAPAASQRELVLSLADAVFIGVRKNPSIRSAYALRAAQKFDLRVAEDVFTPHAALTATTVDQQVTGATTREVTVSPTVAAVTPVGTVFSFSWDNAATRSDGLASRGSIASVGVAQPLLRGAGLDVNLAPVRSARITEDLNQLSLRSTVSDTVTTIIAAYRALLRAQEAKILADNASKRAQALVDVEQQLIDGGRMAQVEIVQAQADVESQKLSALQAESDVDAARFALAALLDLDLDITLVARENLEPTKTTLDVKAVLAIALSRRPDYLGQTFAIEQAKLGLTVANNGLLWDLSLIGNGRLGRQTLPMSALPVRTKIADASVGLQLNIPINDLQREQNALHASTSLTAAEIQLSALRRGIEQQIRTSVSAIDLSWRQLEVARRARSLASSAVEIEKAKLNVGRSSSFAVQTLEANFRLAESQQLNATINYLNALSTLDQQLGNTLHTWKIGLSD